jgi:hypothetical protein
MNTAHTSYKILSPLSRGYILRDELYSNVHGKYEQYFNDLYHLFLSKLTRIPQESRLDYEYEMKLKTLFDQVLQAKRLTEEEKMEI